MQWLQLPARQPGDQLPARQPGDQLPDGRQFAAEHQRGDEQRQWRRRHHDDHAAERRPDHGCWTNGPIVCAATAIPNQADPTVDAYGVININVPGDGEEAVRLSGEVHSGADPCNQYIAAAQAALRAANPVPPPPDQAELIKYTDCMRANGFPNYPYPTANMTFQGTGVDPYSPQVENVSKRCGTELHLPGWWISGNGPPGDVSVSNGDASELGNPRLASTKRAGAQAGPGRQREVGFQWLNFPRDASQRSPQSQAP